MPESKGPHHFRKKLNQMEIKLIAHLTALIDVLNIKFIPIS